MRRESHDSHAAHRDAQRKEAQEFAHEEPLKRSYERVVNGEEAPDEMTGEVLPAEQPAPGVAESPHASDAPQSPADVDAEVAQELAAISGSSPAKYGSLKGKDHNN
jgi:hypothetical protein